MSTQHGAHETPFKEHDVLTLRGGISHCPWLETTRNAGSWSGGLIILHRTLLRQIPHLHTCLYARAGHVAQAVRRELRGPASLSTHGCDGEGRGCREGTGFRWLGLQRTNPQLVSQFRDTWAIGDVCFKCRCKNKYHQRSCQSVCILTTNS